MRKVFTTGQVAKICKVAPRTVSKWFDSGRLKGYRIPGSQDRQVPREHLVRFLKEHGMPLGELEDETPECKLLLVGLYEAVVAILREHLQKTDGFKFEITASFFEAGILTEAMHPDVIMIDLRLGRNEALQICKNIRRRPDHQNTILIALVSAEDLTLDNLTLIQQGFNDVFRGPLNIDLLVEQIRRMLAERR